MKITLNPDKETVKTVKAERGTGPDYPAGGVTLLTTYHRCGRNSGPRGKRINEGAAGSGQEIHYLPSVEKYGKRPEDAHQAYHGRHCGHRQE